MRRTFSVNCPPSSCPTYPGGAPTIRLTVCFSMYSLMSMRIRASALPNMYSASFLAKYVLPTPVGPRNMNAPIGLFGSFSPTRPRWMERTNLSMASSCPMTSRFRLTAMSFSLCPSASPMRCTGMPVIMDTTSAIWSSSTVTRSRLSFSSHAAFIRFSSSCKLASWSR